MAKHQMQMPSPVAVLRSCGWLTADAGLVRVKDVSSSHWVYRVMRSDGAEAIVKRRRPDGRRGIAGELFVYRLANWSALGEVLARPLHIDESIEILAMEALPGTPALGWQLVEPDFMRRMGETLAIVHGATLGQPIPPSPAAGILQVPDHPDATGLDRPRQTRALMHRIASNALLADTLRAAREDYRARCLIHGDLRPEHWVEGADGTLRLLDWEMGGAGDPLLDIASAMVEPAIDAIRRGMPQQDWLSGAGDGIAALARGYRARGGAALIDAAPSRAHIVRLGAARLLHIACEWSDTGTLGSAVDALVDAARSLILRLDTASERLAA